MLNRTTLIDQVYQILLNRIVSGELTPGQRLDVEGFSRELGVSMTPVKDALRLLSADGLIAIHPRRGTFVTQLTPKDIEELFDIRLMVELWAGERALRDATSKDDTRFRRILEQLSSLIDGDSYTDPQGFMEQDSQLHGYLIRLAGNDRLVEIFESIRLNTRLLGVQAACPITDAQATHWEHSEIVTAFERRSVEGLKAAIRQHETNRLVYWSKVLRCS